jgi:hypothetical protein
MAEVTHVVVFAHDMDVSEITGGSSNVLQWSPSFVPTIEGVELTNPTATQVLVPLQDTLAREFNPDGAT